MDNSNTTLIVVLIVAIAVLLFFVLRELFCWYWKINTMVEELKMINTNLTLMLRKTETVKYEEKEEKVMFKPEK